MSKQHDGGADQEVSHLQQVLTAAVDGEANELELRQLLKACNSGGVQAEHLLGTWRRHSQLQSAMQQSQARHWLHCDIASAVSEAIADEIEAPETVPLKSTKSSWLKPLSGLAVAASVAVVTVVGIGSWQQAGQALQGEVQNLSNLQAQVPVAAGNYSQVVSFGGNGVPLTVAGSTPVETSEQARQRLEAYLMKHAERRTVSNAQGMMPMARVVSYQVE
jgi:sigma-E factor negative regulatory protein RseA